MLGAIEGYGEDPATGGGGAVRSHENDRDMSVANEVLAHAVTQHFADSGAGMRAEAPQGIPAASQLVHQRRFGRTVRFDDPVVRAVRAGRRGKHRESVLDLAPIRRRDDGNQFHSGS